MTFVSWLNIEKESLVNIMDSFSKYHSKLHLSQVILFFERNGIFFTKTMIQNYVRIGILPPLYEKRYYIKEHIILLFFIDSLKAILSLDELKLIFKNIEDLEVFYEIFMKLSKSSEMINSIDFINIINNLQISEKFKKALFLILYYRKASITKNLINNL